ncbi:MAG: nucleoside triphosphate pyrophosphohydrolase [Marinagarivorans sp.]|nr:nucleoside triphosphate pyrophosphohydrolase [Marinagarivorans sp.]
MAIPYGLVDLLYLMRRLRDPKDGCPWDIKQSFKSIAPSTIEEAYEVVDAIERENMADIKEELGDLLFQVIFYAELGREQNAFDFDAIVAGLVQKLVRRHPHVFPDQKLYLRYDKADVNVDVKAQWEAIKSGERADKGKASLLSDIPVTLPAITRATKLQKRAAAVNFDWSSCTQVLEKLQEEISELQQALSLSATNSAQTQLRASAIENELGDVLFTVINLARHINVEPETALRGANNKFTQRFNAMAAIAEQEGVLLDALSAEQLDELWLRSKQL